MSACAKLICSKFLQTLFVVLASALPIVAGAQSADVTTIATPAPSATDAITLLRLAEGGDSRAAFLLGMRYATGRETEKDDSEAVRWLGVSAEAGLAEAQYNLGIMYATGRGVARDTEQAARWYAAAADQGLAKAQYNLGALYALGEGVGRDEQLAVVWFGRAAEEGVPEAQYNLGVLHELGRGVSQDVALAMEWYRRAAERGYEPARSRLAFLGVGGAVAEDAVSRSTHAPGASSSSHDERRSANPWLARLDPGHYTLQLLSHTDEDSVRRFVETNFPEGEVGYFAFLLDGTTWYTVIHGDYPSYGEAKAAIESLDASLQERQPWVRKIGIIQKAAIR